MSKASWAVRAADAAHKVVVTGLFSYFCFQAYQIGRNIYESKVGLAPSPAEMLNGSNNASKEYFEQVKAKIIEHEENDKRLDAADMYRDPNYLKNQVQAYRPKKKSPSQEE